MASRPWRVTVLALALALSVWVWGLAGVLYVLRWNSVDRPGPPVRELFPYGELRVGVDASFPPFAVATADDLFGLDIDLARALGDRLDIPVRFVNLGYDGLYDALRVDQVDVLISALLVDPARRGDVNYTRPYFNAGLVLVSPASAPLASMQEIPGRRLAYEFAASADAEARLWLRRVRPFTTMPYELASHALDAVRLGEADAALVDAISARVYLRDHPAWSAHTVQVTDAWYAIATRLDRGPTWTAVNNALQSLDDDGILDSIIARWL